MSWLLIETLDRIILTNQFLYFESLIMFRHTKIIQYKVNDYYHIKY